MSWPDEYLSCLRWSDGLEGYVGGRGYLWLWSSLEVPRLNAAYCVAELAPGLVLFGSDAAAIGYGFDFSALGKPVVSIEMSAMHRGYIQQVAPTFTDFLRLLAAEPLPEGTSELEDWRPPEWSPLAPANHEHSLHRGASLVIRHTGRRIPAECRPLPSHSAGLPSVRRRESQH